MQTINVLMTKFSKRFIFSTLLMFLFIGLSSNAFGQGPLSNILLPLKKSGEGQGCITSILRGTTTTIAFQNNFPGDLSNVSIAISAGTPSGSTINGISYSYNYSNPNSTGNILEGEYVYIDFNIPHNFPTNSVIYFTLTASGGSDVETETMSVLAGYSICIYENNSF